MTKTVTMTHEQWTTLTCYILMTTQHRKGEKEAWEKLSKETDECGIPAYPNATGNARFWAEMEDKLDEICKIIDGAKLMEEDGDE